MLCGRGCSLFVVCGCCLSLSNVAHSLYVAVCCLLRLLVTVVCWLLMCVVDVCCLLLFVVDGVVA